MAKRCFPDAGVDELRDAVVGHRIVAVGGDGRGESETITLDDGTVLTIEDASDCCAGYFGVVRRLAETDNIVTDVRMDDLESDEPDAFTLVIVAGGLDTVAVDVEGDPTSGYYCHSITLQVSTPDDSTRTRAGDNA